MPPEIMVENARSLSIREVQQPVAVKIRGTELLGIIFTLAIFGMTLASGLAKIADEIHRLGDAAALQCQGTEQ